MNRFPQLKSFLKDGEAEQYQGISIRYVAGREAILTIYNDGVEQEKVHLHTLTDKASMHRLFQDKGFVKKEGSDTASRQLPTTKTTQEEVRDQRRAEKERKRRERELLGKQAPEMSSYLLVYGGLAAALAVVATVSGVQRRRKNRKRGSLPLLP